MATNKAVAAKVVKSHPGPKSALEGGEGSFAAAEASNAKGQVYSVQCHTDEDGLFVLYFKAEGGDDAINQALKAEGYKGISIRGCTPATDPDANSMGGERDAAVMVANAENGGAIINTLGTEANIEATKKLGRADVRELGA